MAKFSIDPAAVQEIRYRIASSGIEQPIASLLDASQTLPASSELLDALSRGATESEMLAIGKREHQRREATLRFHLDVGIYDANDCPAEYHHDIDGIPFAMAAPMLDHFADHVLHYVDGAFVLKSGDRVFSRLMAVFENGQGAV